MKCRQRVLISILAVLGMVGSGWLGPVASATGQTIIQEEGAGVKFKVTRLDLSGGGLDVGYYDMENLDLEIRRISLVYDNSQTVTRQMMTTAGTQRPDWGVTVLNVDPSTLVRGNYPMGSGTGITFVNSDDTTGGIRLEADWRAANGRLYYAVDVVDTASGKAETWVGGWDFSACSSEVAKACRPVSTKWGITKMAQDYESWGAYGAVAEEETAGINYTGWKPEPVVEESVRSVEAVASSEMVVEQSIGQPEEQYLGSEYVLMGAAQNAIASLQSLVGQDESVAEAEQMTSDENWEESWQDDGYYGTLDVPELGDGVTEKCCGDWVKWPLIIILIVLAINTAEMLWRWLRSGQSKSVEKPSAKRRNRV